VAVAFRDAGTDRLEQAKADWCICTIPLPVLSGIEIDAGPRLRAAIGAVAYAPAVKVGLQFRRRFWEEDEGIYGGITFTDLPIGQISYPSTGFLGRGGGVLLGAYSYGDDDEGFAGLPARDQVRQAVAYGARIHPQYGAEFEAGMAVAWHRMPFAQGCHAVWDEAARREHYQTLCAIDGRLVLAGEHASYLSGWQEGAILSALDAIARLHERVVNP
jgi:monoamine oxidase